MTGVIRIKVHDDETCFAAVNDKVFVVLVFCREIAEDTAFVFGCFNV